MNHETADVSVVIPTYNSSRWLSAAVCSVLGQRLKPLEVIVIDDGSQDDTFQVAGSFGGSIRYIRQSNQGVSVARNRGVAESKGRFIAFLDSDDEWLPDKLAVQIGRLATRTSVVASFMNMTRFDETTDRTDEIRFRLAADVVEDLILNSCVIGAPSSVMVRRDAFDAVGGFDPSLSQCADWDMWIRLAGHGPIDLVEQPLVRYRSHGENMSRKIGLLEADTLRVLKKFFSDPGNLRRHGDLEKRAYSNHYMILAGSYLHAGQLAASLSCLARALALRPAHLFRALGTPFRASSRRLGPLGGASPSKPSDQQSRP